MARNTTVTRHLSLPFRRDVDTPWQSFSSLHTVKNSQNTPADTSNTFGDVDVESQSFSIVKEIPPQQSYGEKVADAVLRIMASIRSFGRRIIRH